MKIFHSLCGGWADSGDPRAANLASIVVELKENLEKRLNTVGACENDPVVSVRVLDQFRELAQIRRRLDPNRWQFKHMRAERAQLAAQRARLFPASCNHDPFSRKRPLLVPIQTFPSRNNLAKHRDRRCFKTT